MTTITKSIDVDVPIDTAYNQWTQFETFPEFMGGVDKIEQLNDRSLVWHVNVAGVKRTFDAEITEQHPEERVAWKSVDGVTHAGVVTFHKLGRLVDPRHRPARLGARRHARKGRRPR